MHHNKKMLAGIIVAVAALSACSTPMQQNAPSSNYPNSNQAYINGYGILDSIQAVNTPSSGNANVGVGTVGGAVVGGLLGNQVGGGSGRALATAAGVVGGALAGNQMIDKNRNSGGATAYQVGVRMDNGGYQTLTQPDVSNLSIGQRVRIENGRVYRY